MREIKKQGQEKEKVKHQASESTQRCERQQSLKRNSGIFLYIGLAGRINIEPNVCVRCSTGHAKANIIANIIYFSAPCNLEAQLCLRS